MKRLTPLQDSLDSQKSKDWDKFKAKTEAVMNDVRSSAKEVKLSIDAMNFLFNTKVK